MDENRGELVWGCPFGLPNRLELLLQLYDACSEAVDLCFEYILFSVQVCDEVIVSGDRVVLG